MAQLSGLPVELHNKILEHALHDSRQPRELDGSPPKVPTTKDRIDGPRTLSSFPFNAALTCSLWRDILACIPECWTQIVFDVAADPTPILNAFKWSISLPEIRVLAFTSATDPAEADSDREQKRVRAIADALQPHIHRCGSIAFDVMYETSLPSSIMFFSQAAPVLRELILKFSMGKTELEEEHYSYNLSPFRIPNPNLATSFPSLRYISLDGVGFMELCLFDGSGEWLKKLETGHLSLRVARFRFPYEDDANFSMEDFALSLSNIQFLRKLHLQDLSLEYDAYRSSHDINRLNLNYLHLENVSKDFLSEFFSCATCYGHRSTIYTRCAIPRIFQPFDCFHLELDRIIADDEINENGARENSLHRVLVGWAGVRLAVRSCPSFDDGILQWLGQEVNYTPYEMLSPTSFNTNSLVYSSPYREKPLKTFPAEGIQDLIIHHCEAYSFEQLRRLVDVRKQASIQEEIDDPASDNISDDGPTKQEVALLFLRGRHPKFTEEDLEWINNTGNISTHHPTDTKFLGDDGQVLDEINVIVRFTPGRDI